MAGRMSFGTLNATRTIGVIAFLGALAWGVLSSGESASANDETRAMAMVSRTVTMTEPRAFGVQAPLSSELKLEAPGEQVLALTVHLKVACDEPGSVQVHLSSPSGTRVLLVDGTQQRYLRKTGLEGWFTGGALSQLSREHADGSWILSLSSRSPARLLEWSLSADLSPNADHAGLETYGEYGDEPDCDGCCCELTRARGPSGATNGSFVLLVTLFLFWRRRKADSAPKERIRSEKEQSEQDYL